MARPGQARPAGFVVAGVSPRLVFNDDYRGFLELLAGHVATAVANARAYEEERRRAEELAELDRAKTAFFSNVSHEFRTPLTLMLGPVEDMLAGPSNEVRAENRERLEVVHRNGQRLLRLVNTLLDFSRIEAGRVRASYEPTDLAAYTADLASNFRSACERAGLRLEVDCPPLDEPVFVDRSMWEKVVLNLLSNAFKFTFEGEIAVTLRRVDRDAVLRVRDTGTGIPAEEMPRLFERFHRVENARGRTHEGSGIGLALVQELARLHGGSVTAESVVGRGATFAVTIPLGSAHLAPDRIGSGGSQAPTATVAASYVGEAMRWLPQEGWGESDDSLGPQVELETLPWPGRRSDPAEGEQRPLVLVADDNADMRRYVARLLAPHYRIVAVPDGEAALAAARESPPDLILTDVMMPRLDGFGLLRELRADLRTRVLPVIMLSARAGEESRVEGMEAGADDYLVKPFGARELLARVASQLDLARLRREAEQERRRGEERSRAILESITDAFFAVDRSWRFTYVNPQAERLLGRSTGDLRGKVLWDEYPGLAGSEFERAYRRTAEEGITTSVTAYYPDHERWYEVHSYPAPDGLSIYFRDVTERVRAEERERRLLEAAAAANAKFRALFDQGPLFAGIMGLDGTLLEVNRLGLEAGGFAPEQVLGRKFWDCPWWSPSPEVVRIIREATARAAAGEPFRAEVPYHVAGGGRRVVDFMLMPIKDEAGRVLFLGPTGTDVTERKRAEEALREADRRKDEFLATLAHELRNPLAPIRNALHLMGRADGDGPMEAERAMAERQVVHLARLIDDLMDVARISKGKLELHKQVVDLHTVVRQATQTARTQIDDRRHRLTVTLPEGPIRLEADPTRLEQVFWNLLNNAAKYTEPGGRIDLTAEAVDGWVVVRVRDTGIGIEPAMLPRLFQMFVQVGEHRVHAQGGLGIGLGLVRTLVELHGGTINALSDGPGTGSEFVVRLPLLPAATPEPAAPRGREPGNQAALPRRRILVVDDNVDAAVSLSRLLERLYGQEVRVAHDGPEALEVAAGFRPEVILLDIGLPGMDGHEVARRLRGRPEFGQALIAALTGWGQEQDRRKTQEAGFDRHLVKPVDPEALRDLLSSTGVAAR